ncbi:hypothetical protein ACFE04_024247 [Oxalis oulophora]
MKKFHRGCCPSFLKQLTGDCSTKLSVPPAFMKHFNGELPKITTLKSSKEKSWGVLMEKSEKGYFFSKGWSKFVNDHDLQIGDSLVFWLITNSSFEVVIYDGDNACVKDTSFVHKQHATTTPSTLLPNSLNRKVDHKKRKIEQKNEPITRAITLHFAKEMTNLNMKYNINVPVNFAKETGLESMNTVTLKYITECGEEEEWPVEVQKQNECHDRVKLGSGWFKFWTAKGLCVGDSCLFEFVDGSLHVKVFRKVIKKANHKEKDNEQTAAVNVDSNPLIRKDNRKRKKIEPRKAAVVDSSIKPPNNLQFVKKISHQNLKSWIWVPVDFARKTGLISKNMVTLKDISEGGRGEEWPVRVQISGGRLGLSSGWSKFGRRLSVGDSCLFEFVRDSLHVKVLRKEEQVDFF